MLDTIEELLSTMGVHDQLKGERRTTAAQAMVPMLDWPTDLFNTFTAEADDESE